MWFFEWKQSFFFMEFEGVRKSFIFLDIGTRGGSLASSRGYLEIAGNGQSSTHPERQNPQANHTSPLHSKYTDQSLLSFCSNVSFLYPPCIISFLFAWSNKWSSFVRIYINSAVYTIKLFHIWYYFLFFNYSYIIYTLLIKLIKYCDQWH